MIELDDLTDSRLIARLKFTQTVCHEIGRNCETDCPFFDTHTCCEESRESEYKLALNYWLEHRKTLEPKDIPKWTFKPKKKMCVGRPRMKYEYNGKSQYLTDWAKEYDISPATLTSRVRKGWDMERALTQPVESRRTSKERKERNGRFLQV